MGAAHLGEAGQLGAHDGGPADDLMQRRLPLMTTISSVRRSSRITCWRVSIASRTRFLRISRYGRVSADDRTRVLPGLQQVWHQLRLVGLDLRGGRLGDEVVQPTAGQDVGVWLPPAACPGRLRDGGQGPLLLLADAVLGEQVSQVPGADAALPRLDPADLGTVAFQDPGRVVRDR